MLYNGYANVHDFVYNLDEDVETNQDRLGQSLVDSYIWPIKKIDTCAEVEGKVEAPDSKPYKVVVFHLQKDEDEEVINGVGESIFVMAAQARHERFLYNSRDIEFYWIEDVECMHKYGISAAEDSLVFFSRKDPKDPNSGRNHPLENHFDLTDFSRLNRWLNIMISDIERDFTDRVIWTAMHESPFLCVLVREGGRPRSEEDFSELGGVDKQSTEAFNGFLDRFQFQQNRVLFFHADPYLDMAVGTQTIKEFLNVDFAREDLPLMILVNVEAESIEFFEPRDDMTEDGISDFISGHVFYDLFEAMENATEDNMVETVRKLGEAYKRATPEGSASRDAATTGESAGEESGKHDDL